MGVSQRRARQKESLRQEILDAARVLFAREGVESVSIRKIAERIEYAPGTIYLYFQDKAEILRTLCQETFVKLQQSLQSIKDDRSDTLDSLRRGMRAYIEFGINNPNHYLVTFVYAGRYLHESGHHMKADDPGICCFDNFRAIVRKCIEEGYFRLEDVDEVSQAMWSGMHGITTLLITKPGFPFIERTRLVDRVVDILVEGVRRK
jgi:AcrR family transcriptional regulator